MKYYPLSFLLLFLFSCNIDNESELSIPASTFTPLNNTTIGYNSGDLATSLLGYGYDASGFCDTTAGREKIVNLDQVNTMLDHPTSSSSALVSADSFHDLVSRLMDPNQSVQSGFALSQHLKSLLRLAYKTDSMEASYGFVYYACIFKSSRYRFHESSIQNGLTENFKKDIDLLPAKELISKYGTHVLTDISLGQKSEVLYRMKSKDLPSADDCESGFFNRMNQFIGYTWGVNVEHSPYSTNDEQMIINTLGGGSKVCGILNATDYNPDKIKVNFYSPISHSNNHTFIMIGKNGLIPLWDLIADSNKKQEIKAYIENYLASNN